VKIPAIHLKLPKAPPKARLVAIIAMTGLVMASGWSVLSDFPMNGNPFTWLKAKELYLDGIEMRKRFMLPGALQKLEAAVQKYPNDSSFQYALGEAEERLERYQDAEAHFQQAVKINPKNVDAWLHMASVYYQLKKPDESEKATRQALQVQPDNAEAQCQLASLLALSNKKDEADKLFLSSQHAPHPSARFYFLTARYLQGQNQNSEALKAYAKAVKMDRDSPEFAESYGMFLLNMGNAREAVRWLRSACQINPNNADCWEALGLALFAQNANYDAAIAMHEAVKRAPENAVYVKRFGVLLFKEQRYQLAEEQFRKLISRGSEDMSVWNLYMKSAEQITNFGDMKKQLSDVADKGNDRTKSFAYTFLGDVHFMQGNEEAAYGAYRKAAALDPNDELKKYLQDRFADEKKKKEERARMMRNAPKDILKKVDPLTRKELQKYLKP